jgi:hypothetical protein
MCASIEVTDGGIAIEISDAHSENVYFPIDETDGGIASAVSDLQSTKASSPIDVNSSGSQTRVSVRQSVKHEFSMSVTSSESRFHNIHIVDWYVQKNNLQTRHTHKGLGRHSQSLQRSLTYEAYPNFAQR